nr:DUF397 domain-containing protein [Amycolatopsis pretoriensis]
MEIDDHQPSWRKSSRCQNPDGGCVELVVGGNSVRIRDSQHPAGGFLIFRGRSWCAFVVQQKGP